MNAADPERCFRNKQVLVTGAAGFIGGHLLRRLHSLGARITAIDLSPGEPLPGVEWRCGDIRSLAPADLDGARAEVILHLAAVLGVRYAAEHPAETVSVNVAGTARVLALAQPLGASQVCLLSSSEVYGEPDAVPITEEAPPKPRSVYGWSKLCAEELLRAYAKTGLHGIAIRPFNVYGPGQRDEFVVSRFLRQALAGDPLTIAGDGAQRRVFTYVDDLISGMLLAVARDPGPFSLYNLAGEGDLSIADLAGRIVALTGSQAPVVHVATADLGRHAEAEVRRRIPAIEKARQQLGYQPSVDLDEGLQRLLRWQMQP